MINLTCEHLSLFDAPNPKRQRSIQGEIYENSPKGCSLSFVPAQFIIGVKCDRRDNDSGIA